MTLFELSKFVVLVPIALVSFVGLHTLFRCWSEKKNYFLLCLGAILIELLGHLLELISVDAGEGFVSIRVFYLGVGALLPFILLFIADYCDVKLHKAVKTLLFIPAVAFIVGAWTTNTTGLLFSSFYYDLANTHYIVYEPGSLIWLFRFYPIAYAAGAFAILLKRLRGAADGKKTIYGILMLSVFLPFLSDLVYDIIIVLNNYDPTLYVTPYSLSVMAVLLYLGVVKYDMFDSAPLSAIQAMNTINEAVILLDEQLCFVFANNAAYSLLPWLSRFIPGDNVHASPNWPSELSAAAFEGVMFNSSFTLTDGEPRHYRAKVHLFASGSSRKKHWSVLIQDVTESEVFMKQLEEAAYTDTLTGLYNRRHFTEIATPFIERAKRMNLPYYVMIADLDFFKDINDTYGHLAGDAVLRNIAAIMKSAVRSYDILARWGGEEFIFLITDSDVPIVLALSERIRQNVENAECVYQGNRLRITISFGIAQNRSDSDADITELILRADEALYRSKQNGRNRITFWSE